MTVFDRQTDVGALLRWYVDMGVDEAVGSAPEGLLGGDHPPSPVRTSGAVKFTKTEPSRPIVGAQSGVMSADEAVRAAAEAATHCATLDELARAVDSFEGCPLKAGARNTVFVDGAAEADLLVIGEAPGRDEDAIGKPFVGRAGKLLDKMLASIGRARAKDTLISNVVYWRPPGNRTPTQVEIAICRPFVDRLIEIVRPRAIALAGGTPMQALTGLSSIMRSRGTWRTIETAGGTSVDAIALYHPAFLLRQPAHKRHAWADLLALEKRLTRN